MFPPQLFVVTPLPYFQLKVGRLQGSVLYEYIICSFSYSLHQHFASIKQRKERKEVAFILFLKPYFYKVRV